MLSRIYKFHHNHHHHHHHHHQHHQHDHDHVQGHMNVNIPPRVGVASTASARSHFMTWTLTSHPIPPPHRMWFQEMGGAYIYIYIYIHIHMWDEHAFINEPSLAHTVWIWSCQPRDQRRAKAVAWLQCRENPCIWWAIYYVFMCEMQGEASWIANFSHNLVNSLVDSQFGLYINLELGGALLWMRVSDLEWHETPTSWAQPIIVRQW